MNTRTDEIYWASENEEMPYTTSVSQQSLREAWRNGAQWADQHPRNFSKLELLKMLLK